LQVYVSGRVEQPGAVTLPQGSSLVQAIDLAGGTKVLHGKVEFIRFTREGEIDRRIFGFKSDAPASDYRNPVLMAGDVIRLRETALTKSLALIDEITTPAVGVYSVFSLFDGFSN
jgi:polysaccharide export outer membrane protein